MNGVARVIPAGAGRSAGKPEKSSQSKGCSSNDRAAPVKYETWQCQKCGAPIGYIGRFFQLFLGCFLARLVPSNKCSG